MLNRGIIAFDIQAHAIIKLPGSQGALDALDRLLNALRGPLYMQTGVRDNRLKCGLDNPIEQGQKQSIFKTPNDTIFL